MARVIVVGDGPAGLSAALFLAKNGHDVAVYGRDETAMHYALLRNFLGIEEIAGTDFQEVARSQVEGFGAELSDDLVTGVRDEGGDGLAVSLEGGGEDHGEYLVIAGGQKARALLESLGIATGPDGVEVDRQQRTASDRVYAVGRITRPRRSQAIISAGAGAIAALDIMAREAGQDVTDWDTPPDS